MTRTPDAAVLVATPAPDTPDDHVPSRGPLTTKQAVRIGGPGLLGTLFALNFFDEFGLNAMAVLGPDIQDSLGFSDTALVLLSSLGGVMILVGAVPLAVLADKKSRTRVIAVTSVFLGFLTVLTGAAQSLWQLAVARIGAGINKGNLPAFNSVMADAVPVEARARIFGLFGAMNPIAAILTPVTAGGIAALAGGPDGWRWAFLVTGVPVVVLGLLCLVLKDPVRGRFEREALGLAEPDNTRPPQMDEAVARLKRIKTFYSLILAFSVVGVGLFVVPTLSNLYLSDTLGLSVGERGLIGTVVGVGPLIGTILAGSFGDRLYQRAPELVLKVCGWSLGGMLFTVVAVQTENVVLYCAFSILGSIPLFGVFVLLAVATAPVVPPHLRSMGFALSVLYIAVAGGLGGSLLGGALSSEYGERTAITVILIATVPFAMLFMLRAAGQIQGDIAAVARDLLEEEEQRERRLVRPEGPLPGEALIEVRRLNYSYGQLQVLFDVEVDVKQGEVLALLGTNGAGKSTLLRAITGLGLPDSGVVRFGGDDITYVEAANRVKRGIVMVPGGKAIFQPLSVGENLRMGGFLLSDAVYGERRDDVLELFPVLRERLDQPAGSMSGGERQMLAIAKALLLQPRLLCIDELSLGLAPRVVEQLIAVVATLKERGVTMIIVEQSVNVALSLADRAVFMEKGHIRFEGPAAELLERGDLVRAVFLGGDGG